MHLLVNYSLEIIKSQLGLFFIILTFLLMCDINISSFYQHSASKSCPIHIDREYRHTHTTPKDRICSCSNMHDFKFYYVDLGGS